MLVPGGLGDCHLILLPLLLQPGTSCLLPETAASSCVPFLLPIPASFARSLASYSSHRPDPLMTGAGRIQVNRSLKSTWNYKPGSRGMGNPAFNMHWCPLNKLPCAGDILVLPYSPMWNTHYHHPQSSRGHTDTVSAGRVWRKQSLKRPGNETEGHRGVVCNNRLHLAKMTMLKYRAHLLSVIHVCPPPTPLCLSLCCHLVATYDSTAFPTPNTHTP